VVAFLCSGAYVHHSHCDPSCKAIAAGQTYVTIAEHRVPFERIDTLQQLLKEIRPVLAEAKRNGGIVDDVWLIHRWAGEYNVVNITTYKSWSAIEDTTLGYGPAQRKVSPDSVARKKINDRFNWVFKGCRTGTTST
jgi:hypothetical protein